MAILAGGDYSKGLRGCSPSLAFKIAEKKPKHCGLLWTLARNPSLRAAQLPKWRNCLAEDLRTGVFGQKYPSIANSLSDKSPKLSVIDNYMKEIEKQPTIKTIDWSRDVDLPELRKFTEVYFDWKYRQYAVKFVRATVVPLLVHKLLRCRELGRDGSEWILAITLTKGTGSAREIRVKPDHDRVVPIRVLDEPIVEGYEGNLKKMEVDKTPEWLPYWLVEQACPSLFQRWQEEHARKNKRKSTGEDPSEGTTPKRARGRPPKGQAVAAVQGQATPKRGPGRPPKPKQHSAAGKSCVPALERSTGRLPLDPKSPNRRATDAMPHKASSAPAYPPLTPNQARRGCLTEPRLVASARSPSLYASEVIDLTDDD